MTRVYRPDTKPDGPLAPAFREIPDAPANGWECEWCCHENPASAKDCESCRRPPRDEPDPIREPAVKRTRRPKGPLDEIDQHIAAIQTARHDIKKYQAQYEMYSLKKSTAYDCWYAAEEELKRLTGKLTPPPETATANPEE